MTNDAYLVHASEDAANAKQLVDTLQARGLSVWFNRFIVGPSIREQMERGLVDSDFGIVMLSPHFLAKAKKWARHELDALMGIEEPGEVRILPVWWGVKEKDVRALSPMIAMRSAAVLGDAGVDGVADELFESILQLSWHKSLSKRLRLQIAHGFEWRQGPVWMQDSLAEYERTDDFLITDLSYFPEVKVAELGQPSAILDVLRAHTFWDGKRLTVVGRQVRGSVQVFDEVLRAEDLPDDPTRPADASIAAYVFQLDSVAFTRGELCYVHCIGPYQRSMPSMGPNAPEDDWLCWVSGLLLAFGHMTNARGQTVAAAYFGASSIMFTPPLTDGSETAEGEPPTG